jgi:NarL family two-component system response regulator LiaR
MISMDFLFRAEAQRPQRIITSLQPLRLGAKNLIFVIMTDKFSFLRKYKTTILYSISLAFLIFLLKWLELRFIIFRHSFEIYFGFIAVIFTGLGIWLATKLTRPKIEKVVIEKKIYIARNEKFILNTALISELDISKREMEILNLMAQGHSNDEIAEKIFVSISTVKSHNQNLFVKLDVKRRTQAVEKARKLNLIP